jgi:hypothetical protein
MIKKIQSLLGAEADDLLKHKCTGFPKESLHLPGPDFIDRVSATKRKKTTKKPRPKPREGYCSLNGRNLYPCPHLLEHTNRSQRRLLTFMMTVVGILLTALIAALKH